MARRRTVHSIAGWGGVEAGVLVVGVILYQVMDRAFRGPPLTSHFCGMPPCALDRGH